MEEGIINVSSNLMLQNVNTDDKKKEIINEGVKQKKKITELFDHKNEEKSSSNNSYHTASSKCVLKHAKINVKNSNENEKRIITHVNKEKKKNEKNVIAIEKNEQKLRKKNIVEKRIIFPCDKQDFKEKNEKTQKPKCYAYNTVLKKIANKNHHEQLHKNKIMRDTQTVLKKKYITTDAEQNKLNVSKDLFYNSNISSYICENDLKKSDDKTKSSEIKFDENKECEVKEKINPIIEKELQENNEHTLEKDVTNGQNSAEHKEKQICEREKHEYFPKEQSTKELEKTTICETKTKNENNSPGYLKLKADIEKIKYIICVQCKKYKHKMKRGKNYKNVFRRNYYYTYYIPQEYANSVCQTKLLLTYYQRELDAYLSVVTNLQNIVFKEREKYKELKEMLKYTTTEIEKENNKLYEELNLYKSKYNILKTGLSNIGYGSIVNIKEKHDIQKNDHKETSKNLENSSLNNNEKKEEFINDEISEDGYIIVNSSKSYFDEKYRENRIEKKDHSSFALLKFIDF